MDVRVTASRGYRLHGVAVSAVSVMTAVGMEPVEETPLPYLRERIDREWKGVVLDHRPSFGFGGYHPGAPIVTLTSSGVSKGSWFDNPLTAVAAFLVAFENYSKGRGNWLVWRSDPVLLRSGSNFTVSARLVVTSL